MSFTENRDLLVYLCKEMLVCLEDNPHYCETWLRVMPIANKAVPIAAALGLDPPLHVKVYAVNRTEREGGDPRPGETVMWNIGVTFKGPCGDAGTYRLFQYASSDTDRLMTICSADEDDGLHWRAQANATRVLGQWLRRLLLLEPMCSQVGPIPRATAPATPPSVTAAQPKVEKRGVKYPPDRIRRWARLLRKDDPELTDGDLIACVATDFGCSLRTVRNALNDAASRSTA